MKRCSPALTLFFLLLACEACAFQFEEYRWGDALENVTRQMAQKKIGFSHTMTGVAYSQEWEHSGCDFYFGFSANTKKLAFISISCDTTALGEQLKARFSQQYGPPETVVNNFYYWVGSTHAPEDALSLEYASDETRVTYFGGDYYKQFNEERVLAE